MRFGLKQTFFTRYTIESHDEDIVLINSRIWFIKRSFIGSNSYDSVYNLAINLFSTASKPEGPS
jgi:hypothetical protein